MTDQTKPDYCNQCYQEPTRMGAVLVRVGDKPPELRAAGDVFEVKGKKITQNLKPGLVYVDWVTWCWTCWDKFQETKQLRNKGENYAMQL